MKTLTVVLMVFSLSVGYFLLQSNTKEVVNNGGAQEDADTSAASEASVTVARQVEPAAAGEGGDLTLLEHPKTQDYFAILDSAGDYQKQFSEIEQLDADERKVRAQDLLADIDSKENERVVSKPEALFLKLALMKKVLPLDEFKAYAEGIIQEYKAEVEAGRQAYENRKDPQFETYKQQEAEIVKEVLEMQSFPNGLTREQYLRQRLDEARERIYASD